VSVVYFVDFHIVELVLGFGQYDGHQVCDSARLIDFPDQLDVVVARIPIEVFAAAVQRLDALLLENVALVAFELDVEIPALLQLQPHELTVLYVFEVEYVVEVLQVDRVLVQTIQLLVINCFPFPVHDVQHAQLVGVHLRIQVESFQFQVEIQVLVDDLFRK